MPLISEHRAVNPSHLSDPEQGWRRMIRIAPLGGEVSEVIRATNELLPTRLVYAEGDSWFDSSTPMPSMPASSLLDAIRTPFLTAVVDVSQAGEEVRDMVRGHQARQTQAMFKRFSFHAILLSAGGGDLMNVFADLFAARALASEGYASRFQPADFERLAHPDSCIEYFAEVTRNIGRFVDLRESARDERTRAAPIFVHGYDYLQPRPAGALSYAASRIGRGPWLHPALKAAGLSDAQMRGAADAVIDQMNAQLEQVIAPLPNVQLIDQRGLLTPAPPGSTGPCADWHDEIHPNKEGYLKLARNRWDVPLARALGWRPEPGDLAPACRPQNRSTARARANGAAA